MVGDPIIMFLIFVDALQFVCMTVQMTLARFSPCQRRGSMSHGRSTFVTVAQAVYATISVPEFTLPPETNHSLLFFIQVHFIL
jgi:hypothetical protein